MQEISLPKPFINLPSLNLEDRLFEFKLNHNFYEEAMAKRNGNLKIDKIKPGSICEENVRKYESILLFNLKNRTKKALRKPIEKAKSLRAPFSKLYQNKQELERDILIAYQIGYAQYVLAKHYEKKKKGYRFPKTYCGTSGRLSTGSLWLHGQYNAVFAVSDVDHGYVVQPFVLENPEFRGVILMDPTADQFEEYDPNAVRNLVTVKEGIGWNYFIESGKGAVDFFPTHILSLGILNDKEVFNCNGSLTDDLDVYFIGGKEFLELAYSNPKRLD